MATRLFFRTLATGAAGKALTFPTTGDKSTALPVGTDGGDFNQSQDMILVNATTTAGTSLSYSTLAQTAQQSAMIARFSSSKLQAQTVAANTWTVGFVGTVSNANANARLGVSAYIYRPSTNAVVGFISDSTTTLGTAFAGALQTVTFAGSAVTANAEDFLVLEVWNIASQLASKSYTVGINTSGTTTPTYLQTPQDLSFLDKDQAYIID